MSKSTIRRQKVNEGKGPRTLKIEFGGENLEIVYSRSKYTPKLERSMQDLVEKGLPGSMLAKMLKDQREIPTPLTAETLDELVSVEAQSRIVEMMAEDNRPNLQTSTPPSDTFSA